MKISLLYILTTRGIINCFYFFQTGGYAMLRFTSLSFEVKVMPITKVLPLSWFPMCCFNLQRMAESRSYHTRNLHKNQGQAHLHSSSTWSVGCFWITWASKRKFLGPFLRINSPMQWGRWSVLIQKVLRWPCCTASLRTRGLELLTVCLGRGNWEVLCSETSGQ